MRYYLERKLYGNTKKEGYCKSFKNCSRQQNRKPALFCNKVEKSSVKAIRRKYRIHTVSHLKAGIYKLIECNC